MVTQPYGQLLVSEVGAFCLLFIFPAGFIAHVLPLNVQPMVEMLTLEPVAGITGFHSGLRATGEELVFGIYDGVTGLIRQPYVGARQRGAVGFVSGLGKGFGGFILKDFAALTSVAYTLKGIHKELTRFRQPTAFIRHARIIQGDREVKAQDDQTLLFQREKIEAAWNIVCEIKKETERKGKEGFVGQMRVKRERRQMEKQGVFDGSGESSRVFLYSSLPIIE